MKVDIVIIGGGISGCALLYEIARARLGKVILLEKNHLASATTGQSGGLIRRELHIAGECRLTSMSYDYYRDFAKRVGGSCDFIQTGITYRTINDKRFFDPEAGYINPNLACNVWAKAAEPFDAEYYEFQSVENILVQNNQVVGVQTQQGIIESPVVIYAAGHSSLSLLASYNIPIQNRFFQFSIVQPETSFPPEAYIDMINQFYLLSVRGKVIVGFLNKDHFTSSIDDEEAISLHQLVRQYFPSFKNALFEIKKSADAFTMDEKGICAESDVKGLFLATGWSGGGIKVAPAVASHIVNAL